MQITLIREKSQSFDNITLGTLWLNNNGEIRKIRTLENEEKTFPPGKYKLRFEYSPKFKTHLWEFCGIKGRTEIKFHTGSRPEHSRGCPLLGSDGIRTLHSSLTSSKTYTINVIEI